MTGVLEISHINTDIELYWYLRAITRSILLLLRVTPKALETFKD